MTAADREAPSEERPARWHLDRHYLGLTALFVAMALILTVFHAPIILAWRHSAFEDSGANLAIESLTRHGDRPGIDNGYIYGLLCLGFGHVWYALLGLTPYASFAAWVLGNVLMGWGMARFAYHARVGPAGLALMIVQMVNAKDLCFVYILEPVLLIHALAEQARGRRGVALALVTACAFVKPSIAMVYGLILVLTILFAREGESGRLLSRARKLIPAAVVGTSLLVLLGLAYGLPSLVQSLVPAHAAAIYKENNFGFFFGTGRRFWYFPGVRPMYYLGTPVGFWLTGTLVLIAGGAAGLAATSRRPVRNREIVATCAAIQTAFVCLFFAHAFSYDYYYYVLVMGLAALAPRSRAATVAVAALAAMGLLGNYSNLRGAIGEWRERRPSAEQFGLFADADDRREWAEVRKLIRGRSAAHLAITDGAPLMIPDLSPPTLFFLAKGQLTPLEVERKLRQVRDADFVVEVVTFESKWPSERFPQFRPALDGRELRFDGKTYRVFARPLAEPVTPTTAAPGR